MIKELKDIESVSKALHMDTVTMAYPVLEEKLSANLGIVLDKTFESAIVNLQQGKIESLSSSELRSVKHLKKQSQDLKDIIDERNQSILFAERILKKQQLEAVSSSSSYVDLRFLIPTSNICERLFSETGFSFIQRRMSVLPNQCRVPNVPSSQFFLMGYCDCERYSFQNPGLTKNH
jgi:hypothetical protein